MALIVNALGWPAGRQLGPRWTLRFVRAGDLSSCGGRLLLIGEAALAGVDPTLVQAWLAAGTRAAVLCAGTLDTARNGPWLALPGLRFASPDGVEAALLEEMARLDLHPARPVLALEDWLPAGAPVPLPGTRARRVLEALADLHPIHSVRTWAACCSVSCRSLHRLVHAATGLTPRRVVHLLVLAHAREAERRGLARADLAGMLGYADGSSLGHALRRALRLTARRRPSSVAQRSSRGGGG